MKNRVSKLSKPEFICLAAIAGQDKTALSGGPRQANTGLYAGFQEQEWRRHPGHHVERRSAIYLIGRPIHALEELLVVLPAVHAGGVERAVHLVVAQRSDRSLSLVEAVAALVPFQA